jgi:Kef-type K+ transport system membrane component KefB
MTYFLMLIMVLLVSAMFELTVIPAILIAFVAGMVGTLIDSQVDRGGYQNTEQGVNA